jgi:hypothetical protein
MKLKRVITPIPNVHVQVNTLFRITLKHRVKGHTVCVTCSHMIQKVCVWWQKKGRRSEGLNKCGKAKNWQI